MPLSKSGSDKATEENFKEFRHGSKFKRTASKFGVQKARKQMIAAVLSNKRKSKKTARKRA